MNRVHWRIALLQIGLLVIVACSSDDSAAPGTSSGGSDSGADHGVSGGAGSSSGASGSGGSNQDGSAGSATTPDSSAGGPGVDSDVPEATYDSSFDGNSAPDGASDATEAANDIVEATSSDAGDAASDTSTSGCGICPSGLCLDGGICAACSGDLHCQGGAWRCDLTTHTCVPCLPGVSDNCPAGQYCTTAFACVPGCKGNFDCASGACTNHECEHCQNDLECASGKVCGSTVCAPACSLAAPCTGGFDCCTGHCTDLDRDIQHCGGCTSPCNSAQFCGSTGCTAVTIANVCNNATTTALLNAYPTDNTANAAMQGALTSNCTPPPTASSSPQDTSGLINPSNGQPVAGGGNLITIAGGYYVQRIVDYFDTRGITPVYLQRNVLDSWRYFQRGGGTDAGADGGAIDTLVAEMPMSESTPSHDLILIELVRDPASGTLVLITFGQHAESTAAAASYVANQMLPVANRASYDKSWYAYEWTAAGEGGPETFVLKASGF